MAKAIKRLKFRRRREGKTNYKKRLELVKSGLKRVVVRMSNRNIIGEVIRFNPKGDEVLAYVNSKELKQYKWPVKANKPTAYLTGLLLAKKYKDNEDLILDIGFSTKAKIPFIFALGCIDGGLKIKMNKEFEKEDYDATLISEYASRLKKEDKSRYERQFSKYIKEGIEPEKLKDLFYETVKMLK